MKSKYVVIVLVSVILLIGGLVGYGMYVNMSSNAHVEKLSSAQYSKVVGVKAGYREVAPTLFWSSLYLHSSWMLDVYVKLDGTVTQMYVNPGDQVQAGQLLGEISNPEWPSEVLQAEGKINEARANFIRYDNTYKRYRELVESGSISKQQLDEAVANRSAYEAEVMTAQAFLDQLLSKLQNQKIFAPRSGEILRVYARPGAFVRTGEALVLIGDFSHLIIRENVLHEKLEKLLSVPFLRLGLKEGQAVNKAYEARFHQAKLSDEKSFAVTMVKVEPPLEVPSKYRSVIWHVENAAGELEPGTYYQAKLYGAEKRRVLAVPLEAISREEPRKVFVVSEDSRLQERVVKIGVQDDEYVEILEGLNEGDIVALAGRAALSTGLKVQVSLEDAPVNKP